MGFSSNNVFSTVGTLLLKWLKHKSRWYWPKWYSSTTLHVSGTLRIANGGEACDTNRTGAIRYTAGDFQFCRNGTAWEPLASVANSAAPDRIISGTTTLQVVSSTGFISLTQAGTKPAGLILSAGW